MSEILGVIDALEGVISDSKRLPFTGKALVDQKMVYSMLDKLRQLLQNQGGASARQLVGVNSQADGTQDLAAPKQMAVDLSVLEKAKEEAKQIRLQTDEYADQVLAKLQLMVVKMQQNMIRIEKNLQEGRNYLEKEAEGN